VIGNVRDNFSGLLYAFSPTLSLSGIVFFCTVVCLGGYTFQGNEPFACTLLG
jgi:hypothetical protein